MGSNGEPDGSTDGTITFTADNDGDPGVVTSEVTRTTTPGVTSGGWM